MSNKEKVRAYYNKWGSEGRNEDNGCTIQPYSMSQDGFFNVWFGGRHIWQIHPDSHDAEYDMVARVLGVDQPAAAGPSKSDDYWKSYAKQLRGELTAAQRELADQKAAYNGLCEAHKELAEQHAKSVPVLMLRQDFEAGLWNHSTAFVKEAMRVFNEAIYKNRHRKHEAVPE